MPYFQDFVRGELSLRNYSLLAIPGGIQSLTLEEYLPKFSWAAWRHIKFLMDLDAPARIVLIGHDDCRWYHHGPITRFTGPERQRQETDLRKVATAWRDRFPGSAIDSYYGILANRKATFEPVR